MSTVVRDTRIPADIRRLAWLIAFLLVPCTGLAVADDMTADSIPPDRSPAAGKPVIVAGSAPCRHDLADPAQAEAAWHEWFEPDFRVLAHSPEICWFHLISYDWTRATYHAQTGWKNNDLTATSALLRKLRDPPVPAVTNDPHSIWHGVLLAEAMRKAGARIEVRIGPHVGQNPGADSGSIVALLRQ